MESGIPGFDKVYTFQRKQVILCLGPPSPEKITFIQQFLFGGLGAGEPGLYLTMDHTPSEVRADMERNGWDVKKYEDTGLLRFVDCFSWIIHEKDMNPSVTTITSPSALSEIAIAISTLLDQVKNARVVIDSLSTMMLYNDPTSVFRFFQLIGSKIKKNEAVMIALLEEGMHAEQVNVTLEHLSDGTLKIKTVPDHMLRIERLSNADWVAYKLTEKGLVVLS